MNEALGAARLSAAVLAELVLLFVAVSFLVALADRRLGADRIRRWMGGGPLLGALKGVALGVVTPFCSYSTIPVLVGLLDAEVRLATAAAFVVASPVLDPLLLAAIALLFGPALAAGYAAVTATGAVLAGLVADASLRQGLVAVVRHTPRLATPVPHGVTEATSDGCRAGDRDRPPPWRGLRAESRDAWRSALATTRALLPSVVAAVLVGAVVSVAIPPHVLAGFAGPGNPLAVPAAALLGVPLYVGAEALLPVAVTLLDKGVGLGPVFALLIAGAGVSLPELGMLAGIVGARLVAALVAVVFAVAVAGGLLIPLV